jgi:hypothetical protein
LVGGKEIEVELCCDTRAGAIRELPRLRKVYDVGRWRKRKGVADVKLPNGRYGRWSFTGTKRLASAKRNFKIERFLD